MTCDQNNKNCVLVTRNGGVPPNHALNPGFQQPVESKPFFMNKSKEINHRISNNNNTKSLNYKQIESVSGTWAFLNKNHEVSLPDNHPIGLIPSGGITIVLPLSLTHGDCFLDLSESNRENYQIFYAYQFYDLEAQEGQVEMESRSWTQIKSENILRADIKDYRNNIKINIGDFTNLNTMHNLQGKIGINIYGPCDNCCDQLGDMRLRNKRPKWSFIVWGEKWRQTGHYILEEMPDNPMTKTFDCVLCPFKWFDGFVLDFPEVINKPSIWGP